VNIREVRLAAGAEFIQIDEPSAAALANANWPGVRTCPSRG
jgi:hypothetical protein